MTSGSIRSFSWGLKPKKRHRSGSGGNKDYEAKKKTLLHKKSQKDLNRRLSTSGAAGLTGSNLEVIAPVTSDVEFKYTWPIDGFLGQVKSCSSSLSAASSGSISAAAAASSEAPCGLDSKPFDVNVNGVQTSWNLSIRFWTGEDGEKLANPFVLCLNLLSCRIDAPVTAGIRFRFGVLNRTNDEYELGAPDRKAREIRLENSTELRSVGYKNMAISEKHVNAKGDIQLVCKMSLVKDDQAAHTLSSDLKNLMKDEKSADLVVEAEGKEFKVHRNILSARSPVLASLIEESSASDGSSSLSKVKIDDLKAEILEELLGYIYTDTSTNVDSLSNALLAASDSYKLPGLKSHCERNLAEIISPVNVATVLMLADKYDCEGLKASALNYCKDNHSYIVKDSNWKTIEEEKPGLFEEAVTKVVGDKVCMEHSECIKKKGKRYEIEKASSFVSSTKALE